MNKPDILLYISDQHTPYFSGYFGGNVDTPVMDDMSSKGVNFSACYSACPLCVPSRMSMLSTLMPSRTGIYTNGDTLADTTPTFLHPLASEGYETVLIGRMHFIGKDQRHGFTKRVAPDMTEVTWSSNLAEQAKIRGRLASTFSDFAATKVVGAGESPVNHYDRMVIDSALQYLAEDHERPQCIVVGTYGPHFPYIADPDLYRKYADRAGVPETLRKEPVYMNELLLGRKRTVTDEVARGCAAVYSAQVEYQDRLLGEVREAFRAFTSRRGTERVFAYMSDHGDQVGDRGIYGKNTFFEKSVRVPLLIEGDNITAGFTVSNEVSLLDVGPTLWDLAGTEKLAQSDGVSLVRALQGEEPENGRIVFSELIEKKSPMPGEAPHYARMAVRDGRKLISYHGYENQDMLFDVREDPQEMCNLIDLEKQTAQELRKAGEFLGAPDDLEKRQRIREKNKKLFASFEKAVGKDDSETWKGNPSSARGELEIELTEPWDGYDFSKRAGS